MAEFFIVYKTVRNSDGHYYIGVHSTCDLNDSYLGSGLRLVRSIRKYGKAAHTRHILECFNTKEEAFAKEEELVDKERLKDPKCMNLAVGGCGSHHGAKFHHSEESRAKISRGLTGREISAEHRANLSASLKNKCNAKRCTVDGVIFYPSRKILAENLGHSKRGTRSPSFRYVETV